MRKLVVVLLVAVLTAAACSRSDSGKAGSATTAPGNDAGAACKGQTLRATDVGITADTITVEVMADVGSPLAPGLFQGNVDAMNAYARYVNAHGGLACRRLAVKVWDSKLNADESKNGQIDACGSAFALVGGNALFNPDSSVMANCADAAGAKTGLPDVAAIANDIHEICNPTTFVVTGVTEKCPVPDSGPVDFTYAIGAPRWIAQHNTGLHGIYLVPGDIPTTVQSGVVISRAEELAGLVFDAKPKVSGRAEQSGYTPVIQLMRQHGSNFVQNGSLDTAMIKMRKETAAQGYTGVKLWLCFLSCYTKAFQEAGAAVDGTYVYLSFIPFEEKDTNAELAAFMDTVGQSKIDSWGADAWQAGGLFAQAVGDVVKRVGPNGLTRAALLDALRNTHSFTANGWVGKIDPRGVTGCFMVMQINGGTFRRVYPEKRGTLDCSDGNTVTYSLDAIAEANKLP